MSVDNRQRAARELERADKSLRSSGMLLTAGLCEDSVSRSYCAVLHAAKAALADLGISADSHAGVRRMFGMHLVKDGAIESEFNRILVAEQEDRELGDYDVSAVIDESRARLRLEEAEKFLARIRQHLGLVDDATTPTSDSRDALQPKRKVTP